MRSYVVYLPVLFSAIFLSLFYHELLGINVIIFEVLMIGTSFLVHRPRGNNLHAKIVLTGTILSAVFVLLYGSAIAKTINVFSFFLFLGYRCDIHLRSPLNSLLLATLHIIKIPGVFVRKLLLKKGVTQSTLSRLRFYGKIIVFPILILMLFIYIYILANSRFSDFMEDMMISCRSAYRYILEHFNFSMFYTLLLGLFVSSAYIFQTDEKRISQMDDHGEDSLFRRRKKKDKNKESFKTMDLKKEYYAMLFLLMLLNMLIAIMNVIDIDWVWLNFQWDGSNGGAELKQFVHTGTYLLICAIILSVGISLYIFRNNMNFYERNTWIKFLAYLWLFQNAVMLASVGMRTYRYVQHFNLAHKRIGLLFFLLAMLIVIFIVFVKIRDKKSSYFLVRTCALSSYIVLFTICTIDWDMFIVKYNFRHAHSALLHKDWMMNLSDKTLPIVRVNIHLMDDSTNQPGEGHVYTYKELLEIREAAFKKAYKCRGVFSWNYADARAYKQLEEQTTIGKSRELSARNQP